MTRRKVEPKGICRSCGRACTRNRCIQCLEDQTRYLPTPEEIAAACERIQAGWDERVRRSRAQGHKQNSAVIPTVDEESLVADERTG